jgi:integrase
MEKEYGNKLTYMVHRLSLENVLSIEAAMDQRREYGLQPQQLEHSQYINGWIEEMQKGGIYKKAFSPATIETYEFYIKAFFSRKKQLSIETFEKELGDIPSEKFAKKEKIYQAVVCFAKYLRKHEAIDSSFLTQIKEYEPKRSKDPKQHHLTEQEIAIVLKACETPQERLIIVLIGTTGARASETCNIRGRHINLKERLITIEHGKGGKTRPVGINSQLLRAIYKHWKALPPEQKTGYLLKNRDGNQMDRSGLYQRLQRIGQKVGLNVTPHAIRRAFVTIYASKGIPLPYLQQACGHSDIQTTMGYCQISQKEAVNAMKNWKLEI